MKIGYVSDLHLEHSNMKLDNLNVDCLVLAGDISAELDILRRFITYNIPENVQIIYVAGNHEFEGKRFKEELIKLKNLENEFSNLKFLYNESFSFNGVKFIGSTLWSNFEGNGISYKEESKKWAKQNIADFSQIFKLNTNKGDNNLAPVYVPWNPEDMEEEFKKSYDFLKYELRNNPTNEIKFVVTHFAPNKGSIHEKFNKDLMSSYWVNSLDELLGFSEYWVHGHTHNSFSYNVNGTQVLCNPRGYSKLYDLSQNLEFNKLAMIEVNLDVNKVIKKKM